MPLSETVLMYARSAIKLLVSNGYVDKKYLKRAAFVSIITFLSMPLKFFEKARFAKRVKNLQIQYPPIFILGHWRSGTTYLHNLMAQDPNLGYVSTAQAWGMEIFLGNEKIKKTILSKILPEKRPMDNVKIDLNLPEEEEYLIGNISPFSFYHGWFFSKKMKDFFKKFVLFDGVSNKIKNQWKDVYINILKKITLNASGKRLVLKNPPNTARIKLLLETFPNAKFIHIYRNPYVVYSSTKHLYKKVLPEFTLHDIDEESIEANILEFYQELMHKFFKDKSLIPPDNFVEIKYEDFVGNELPELKRVYDQLNLPGLQKAEENFQKYIESQSTYATNKYFLDRETIEKVYDSWSFTIEKWQYSPPN